MIDKDTQICACNSLSAEDIAKCINFKTVQELLDNSECPMGDKCESCKDVGVNNDGINIPLIFKMVKDKKI